MTVAQLKQFLSDHRSNDEMFSEALGELLKRNPVKRSYRVSESPNLFSRYASRRNWPSDSRKNRTD